MYEVVFFSVQIEIVRTSMLAPSTDNKRTTPRLCEKVATYIARPFFNIFYF